MSSRQRLSRPVHAVLSNQTCSSRVDIPIQVASSNQAIATSSSSHASRSTHPYSATYNDTSFTPSTPIAACGPQWYVGQQIRTNKRQAVPVADGWVVSSYKMLQHKTTVGYQLPVPHVPKSPHTCLVLRKNTRQQTIHSRCLPSATLPKPK